MDSGSGSDTGARMDGGPPDTGAIFFPDSSFDTGPGCGLVTCTSAHATCGFIGDGCGGTLFCGNCLAPETCGGGGTPSQCGGTMACVPRDCASQGIACGPAGDGCGAMLDCGSCMAPDTCGGGGTANVCGHGSTIDAGSCAPRDCAAQGLSCGMTGDGCGAMLDCGSCPTGQTCGGGGVNGACGSAMTACVPRTCASAGAACGVVADGCGGLTPSCGMCTSPAICGGSGVPNQCGAGTDGGVPCTGLCLDIPTCPPGGTTTITGVVTAPGHDDTATWGTPDPLYGVHVYIPNGPVPAFTPGVACDRCDAPLPGDPLVSVTTGPDGVFTLTGVPAGMNIPLVIQLGRWRRQIVIPSVAPCGVTTLPNTLTHMPRNHTEGDIPLMAMVTGDVDVMECVLRKIGIEDPEFSVPASRGGTGRVRFYIANGADISPGAPNESQLWGAGGDIDQYDMVMFACEGGRANEAAADQQRVIDYANAGGRIFATHFSYVWLTNGNMTSPVPFSQTAAWQVNQGNTTSVVATVDTVVTGTTFPFARGLAFQQWLLNVGASTTLGQVTVNVVRHDFNSVVAPAQRWLYTASQPVHYTFDTPIAYPPSAPIPATAQCGRVLFSDFHVEDFTGAGALRFPRECTDGPMTPQERVLEFMLFDLASCITPSVPTCTPLMCSDVGATCGPIGDGCGGSVASCGTCTAPDTCGGGGTPSVCGHPPTCVPRTCASQGITCGPAGDGCGNPLDCGPCVAPDTCGGGGVAGVCGHTTGCTPLTCASQGILCGPAGDGCGNPLDCGPCTAPDTCGGGGMPGVCGHITCTPLTCASIPTTFGPACGVIADGCGGTVDCGPCTAPDTCGGGGHANVCGHFG